MTLFKANLASDYSESPKNASDAATRFCDLYIKKTFDAVAD